ncbi:YraN family protein [Nitratireductor sp. XY-223]|uniref:YraN family protein n=1 Tax=Nitratireductor sp. XY-223 TaxID=2561926 RepID=UPI0010AA2D4B|nr:YraN family protein [Nitratireductor sp. XY-223]
MTRGPLHGGAERRRAYRRGHIAEWLAAVALMAKGYRIVARRFRTRAGEVDLIARKGDLVALVEVKARASEQAAIDAVTGTAARRIAAAGDIWLSRQRDAARLSVRRDIIAVLPRRWPRHFPDAF